MVVTFSKEIPITQIQNYINEWRKYHSELIEGLRGLGFPEPKYFVTCEMVIEGTRGKVDKNKIKELRSKLILDKSWYQALVILGKNLNFTLTEATYLGEPFEVYLERWLDRLRCLVPKEEQDRQAEVDAYWVRYKTYELVLSFLKIIH